MFKRILNKREMAKPTARTEIRSEPVLPDAKVSEEKLPIFRYLISPASHPSLIEKIGRCICCNQNRRIFYNGPTYSTDFEIIEVCPWCIADGSAATKWDVTFNDGFVDNEGVPQFGIDECFHDEIEGRTLGFISAQGNHWMYGKSGPMQFVGEVNYQVLLAENNPRKVETVRETLSSIGSDDITLESCVESGERCSIYTYLFYDPEQDQYAAYWDRH